MNIPHTYFWHLAQSPVMVYNGRLYHLVEDNSESYDKVGYAEVNNKKYKIKYKIIEGETLFDLENLYKHDFSKEIDAFKTDFLNKKLKESIGSQIRWKLKNLEKTKEEINKNNGLLLILTKIIPEIEGKNPIENTDKYSSQISEETISKFRETLGELEQRRLDEKLKKIHIRGLLLSERLNPITNGKNDKSVLGKDILHNFNVLVMAKNNIFICSSNENKNKATINGKKVYFQENKEYKSLNGIESFYIDALQHLYKSSALNESNKRISGLEEVYRQEALLSKLAKNEEFIGEKGGFYRHSTGKFVFYINFPEFVNKFTNDKYYLFPPGKIAIGATYDKYREDFSILRDSISVLTRYYHPFTQPFKDGADESFFCTGIYTIPKVGKGYEKIPQVLVELKTLLMSGYNPYHRNITNVYSHYYSAKEISLQEIKKRKLAISNENIIVSEGVRRRYDKNGE